MIRWCTLCIVWGVSTGMGAGTPTATAASDWATETVIAAKEVADEEDASWFTIYWWIFVVVAGILLCFMLLCFTLAPKQDPQTKKDDLSDTLLPSEHTPTSSSHRRRPEPTVRMNDEVEELSAATPQLSGRTLESRGTHPPRPASETSGRETTASGRETVLPDTSLENVGDVGGAASGDDDASGRHAVRNDSLDEAIKDLLLSRAGCHNTSVVYTAERSGVGKSLKLDDEGRLIYRNLEGGGKYRLTLNPLTPEVRVAMAGEWVASSGVRIEVAISGHVIGGDGSEADLFIGDSGELLLRAGQIVARADKGVVKGPSPECIRWEDGGMWYRVQSKNGLHRDSPRSGKGPLGPASLAPGVRVDTPKGRGTIVSPYSDKKDADVMLRSYWYVKLDANPEAPPELVSPHNMVILPWFSQSAVPQL
eukprot:Sspe_Gene.75350::Locus_47083_Transcript_2_3_Confidence_0.400_Length_1295::g.75350::m.75350